MATHDLSPRSCRVCGRQDSLLDSAGECADCQQQIVPDLTILPTETLRAELARGLSLVAENLVRLGQVWAELERRGEDLSGLRHGLGRTLPLIASGRLAAEFVVEFAHRPA